MQGEQSVHPEQMVATASLVRLVRQGTRDLLECRERGEIGASRDPGDSRERWDHRVHLENLAAMATLVCLEQEVSLDLQDHLETLYECILKPNIHTQFMVLTFASSV